MNVEWNEVHSTVQHLSSVLRMLNDEDSGRIEFMPHQWNTVFPYALLSSLDGGVMPTGCTMNLISPPTTLLCSQPADREQQKQFRSSYVTCGVHSEIFRNFLLSLEEVVHAKLPDQFKKGYAYKRCLRPRAASLQRSALAIEECFSDHSVSQSFHWDEDFRFAAETGAREEETPFIDGSTEAPSLALRRQENDEDAALEFYITDKTCIVQDDGTEEKVRSRAHLYSLCSENELQLHLAVRGWTLNRIFDDITLDVECTKITVLRQSQSRCSELNSSLSLCDLRDRHLRFFAHQLLRPLEFTTAFGANDVDSELSYIEHLTCLFERSQNGDEIAETALLIIAERQSFERFDDPEVYETRQQKERRKQEQLQWCPPLLDSENQSAMEEDETNFHAVPQELLACQTCLKRRANAAFIPCGHVFCCVSCVWKLNERKCPMCRADIANTLRLCFA